MTIDELFQAAVDMPQAERIADARKNLAIVLNYFTTLQEKGYGAVATAALISTFVAADGRISAGEFQFVQDVLEGGVDYETFYNSVQAAVDTNQVAEMDKIIDKAPHDIKKAFLHLCLDFLACDGTITASEIKLINKYAE